MTTPFRAVAVVPAAGSPGRLAPRGLLAPVDGEPVLDRTIRVLLEGGVGEVIVVVGTESRSELERDVNALNDARVRPVENADPARGMFSSIQEGMRTANGDIVLVHPGDMPYVRPETVRLVLDRARLQGAIIAPRYRGKYGHPVALPPALRDEILVTPSSANLHDLIERHRNERVDLDVDDPGTVRDGRR